MGELEYSNEALEAKSLFYNKKITVYVEGKDDPLFWESLFNLAEINPHIESVGGKDELDKYVDRIINENAGFYVATDNDNNDLMEGTKVHRSIIRTYGYSIENSMYSFPDPIEKMISGLCRKKVDFSTSFYEWTVDFATRVYELIVYDIANNKYGKGVSVFGDNCYRFLKSQKAHEICPIKTKEFIESIKHLFTTAEIKAVKKSIDQSEKDLWFLIKGHFITHALINFIKHTVKKEVGNSKSMTPDFLYLTTVDCKENWEDRIDIKTVVGAIKLIKDIA